MAATFEVLKVSNDRLNVTLSGKLDSQAMSAGITQLLGHAVGVEHGKMLYRVGEFSFPSFSALAVELSHLPALFKLVSQFDRIAVLADQSWIRALGEVKGALLPGLAVSAFTVDDEAAAEAWLNE